MNNHAFSHWRREDATRLIYPMEEYEYARGARIMEAGQVRSYQRWYQDSTSVDPTAVGPLSYATFAPTTPPSTPVQVVDKLMFIRSGTVVLEHPRGSIKVASLGEGHIIGIEALATLGESIAMQAKVSGATTIPVPPTPPTPSTPPTPPTSPTPSTASR